MNLGYRFDHPSPRAELTRRDRTLGVLSAIVLLVGSLGWMVHRRQVDLEVYRLGAAHAFSASLYQVSLVVSGGPPLPFTYPPTAAVLLSALRWGSTGLDGVIWTLLGAGALWISLRVTLQWVGPVSRSPAWWALIGAATGVVVNPVLQTFAFGQINLIVMALVFMDLGGRFEWGNSSLPRGVLVGLAGALKLVPLIWIAYFLVTAHYRRAMTATLSFFGVVALAAALSPRASLQYWLHDIVAQSRIGVVSFVSNQSLQGLSDRLLHRTLPGAVVDGISVLMLVWGLTLARSSYQRGRESAAVFVTAATGLLVSPVSWVHHFVWVWPAVVWLVAATRGWSRVMGVLLGTLFVVAPPWWVPHGVPFDLRESVLQYPLANAFGLSALAALLVATGWLRRTGERDRVDNS